MAVLSKPVNMSFEVDKNKTTAFLNAGKKGALQRAIDRSNQHICKATNKDNAK